MTDKDSSQLCKSDELHRMDAIQGHGAMLVVNRRTWLVEACSQNLCDHTGLGCEELLGADFRIQAPELYQAMRHSPLFSEARHLTSIRNPAGERYSMLTHVQNQRLVIELEPGAKGEPAWWTEPQRIQFIKNLAEAGDTDSLCQVLVDMVADSGRFDRVMMYRFLKGWHGHVTHEVCRPGVEGFLGLHFPSSDIPENARRLYESNLQRAICDTHEATAPLIYQDENTPRIDMTHLLLRSVHPVHITYLENLGIRGSLSLSILINGKLWGMLACHNTGTVKLSARERLAMEEIARLGSLHLNTALELDKRERLATKRSQLAALNAALVKQSEEPAQPIAEQLETLLDLFKASGAWFRLGTEEHSCGSVPPARARQGLLGWFQTLPQDKPTMVGSLPPGLEQDPSLATHAAGILYLPLKQGGFVALLRPERVHTVVWAGRPEDSETWDQPALTPRQSFSEWAEVVKGQAELWDEVDIDTATELQQVLVRYLETTRIHHDAHRDPLTGLANRRTFEQTIGDLTRPKRRALQPFALHLLDLDRFKPINDTFGHSVGDILLRMVSSRLEHLVRESDTVARLGGDEFAIVQLDVEDPANIRQLAERLVNEVSQPYHINKHLLEVGASVGIATYPADGTTAEAVFEKADNALYRAKDGGRNNYRLFADDLAPDEKPEEEARELRQALEQEQFTIAYQTLFHIPSRQSLGFEAMARWQHPQKGLLSAQSFLQQLEDNHLMPSFGELVLEHIFRQQRHWQDSLGHSVPIFVNISTTQLLFTSLVTTLQDLEQRHNTGFGWLRLDIQSQCLEQNPEEALRRMTELSGLGASLYLDNFRYGSASVELLGQLSLSGIKASMLDVMEAATPAKRTSLLHVLKGLTDLAGGELIITQVESREIMDWLAGEGIASVQGFAVQAHEVALYPGLKQALVGEAVIDGF